jgi:hypothetical protein
MVLPMPFAAPLMRDVRRVPEKYSELGRAKPHWHKSKRGNQMMAFCTRSGCGGGLTTTARLMLDNTSNKALDRSAVSRFEMGCID